MILVLRRLHTDFSGPTFAHRLLHLDILSESDRSICAWMSMRKCRGHGANVWHKCRITLYFGSVFSEYLPNSSDSDIFYNILLLVKLSKDVRREEVLAFLQDTYRDPSGSRELDEYLLARQHARRVDQGSIMMCWS